MARLADLDQNWEIIQKIGTVATNLQWWKRTWGNKCEGADQGSFASLDACRLSVVAHVCEGAVVNHDTDITMPVAWPAVAVCHLRLHQLV